MKNRLEFPGHLPNAGEYWVFVGQKSSEKSGARKPNQIWREFLMRAVTKGS